jgi:hypothetical protein
MSELIYLASPYSNPDPRIEQKRYRDALSFTGTALRAGRNIFSPIAYGHQFQINGYMQGDAASWQAFNQSMMEACTLFWVLKLPGWEESKGVIAELDWAIKNEKFIEYIGPMT